MSGGSMDYLYIRVEDATFKTNSPERKAFRRHLMRVAKALRSIEWNDSGDGDDAEDANIMACISSADVLSALIDEASKLHRQLAQAIVRAKGFREDGR
jgi:hypothetical protein